MIKYLLLPFGIMYQFLFNNRNEIIILMYHRVNNDIKKELSVKKEYFQWQMNYLKRKNYSVLSMDEAYEKIKNSTIKGKHIVLSFDDGYEDYYHEAFPILLEYAFPSILYLVPGFIDSDKIFWWDEDLEKSDLLGWQQIKELGKNPLIGFGCHTMNHMDLNTLQESELENELIQSKKILEERLERKVKHFSYPRGIYSSIGEKILERNYNTGVLIFNGCKITTPFHKKDRTRLKRIPIQRSDGKFLFVARIKGWLVAEEILRKWIAKPSL